MEKYMIRQMMAVILLTCLCITGWNIAAAENLPKTVQDYEGPFYPVAKRADEDNNLVEVKGRPGKAKGDILNLSGVIVNTEGVPRKDVIIEIWQTDPAGRYLHPGDLTPGERDPDFQYWGRDTTDAQGTFSFKTVLPGAYNPRPAHIHYKLWFNGENILTSQIYFKKILQNETFPSLTDRFNSQTVELQNTTTGEYSAFYRIIF